MQLLKEDRAWFYFAWVTISCLGLLLLVQEKRVEEQYERWREATGVSFDQECDCTPVCHCKDHVYGSIDSPTSGDEITTGASSP